MKKNNIKWIFNNHSTERFFERTALNVTKKQIAKAITNNQIVYFKRVNATRSMAYIHVNSEVIKTVMHRKKDKIITILPWKSIYQAIVTTRMDTYGGRTFKVKLFPDCFLETKKPNALTVIYEKVKYTNGPTKGQELLNFDNSLFKDIFTTAWKCFESDAEHQLIQKERSHGCETFEIKGKAKEITTILKYV
jgi:hypothetical protein